MILDGIGKIVTSALDLIPSADFSGNSDALEHWGILISMNHGFLVSLGVSHPRLERIRELVDYPNISWTKLTGAGGGGCAITLFRPDPKTKLLKSWSGSSLLKDFKHMRLYWVPTELACFGLRYSGIALMERLAKILIRRCLRMLTASKVSTSWLEWEYKKTGKAGSFGREIFLHEKVVIWSINSCLLRVCYACYHHMSGPLQLLPRAIPFVIETGRAIFNVVAHSTSPYGVHISVYNTNMNMKL